MAFGPRSTLWVRRGGRGGGGIANPPPPPPNITGNWQLSATSTVPGMPVATIAGSITQSGSSVSGVVHLDGSNCFDELNTISLTGTLTDGLVSLISASVDGQVITFTVNLNNTDSNALAGTYAINGGCANGDQGNVTGSKVPAINGTWRIILDINDALEQDRTTLAQESTGPEGSFGVNGTAFINAPSCFSGTITSGTFPSPSYIMGTSVNLEIETADGTITFLGTMDQFGTKILGSHQIVGGICGGFAGPACLGRSLQSSCFH